MNQTETILDLFGTADALAETCRRFRVRRLYLFGSAATEHGFDPARSGIDLLVTFEELGSKNYLDAYFGLHKALSGRPVDLLTDASIENPYLRRRIDSERRLLFQAL